MNAALLLNAKTRDMCMACVRLIKTAGGRTSALCQKGKANKTGRNSATMIKEKRAAVTLPPRRWNPDFGRA